MKAFIVLAMAAVAAAQVDLKQVFSSLDANSDHFLSLTEMMVYFNQADHDGNGKVTFEEYTHDVPANTRHTPEVQGPFFYYDKLDGSKDNAILPSDVSIVFNRIDTNKDSKISAHEFVTGFRQVEAGMQAEIDALKSPVGK